MDQSTSTSAAQAVRAYRTQNEKAILEEYCTFLSMPNVATNVADVEANAAYVQQQLARRGFTTRLLRAGEGTPPSVFGELTTPGADRTVVFYAHIDGQPAAEPDWHSSPWSPVVRSGTTAADSEEVDWRSASAIDPEWRLYARSASDDKAPIQAMLAALDGLAASGLRPSVNVKVFYEGEEEQGSPTLTAILDAHGELLGGDVFVLSDGPVHASGQKQLFFGARGTSSVELTVYGPARPLHSGHFGNWAPNPALMLVRLLSSLRDEDGQILIPSYYDDVTPLSPAESDAIEALPDVETGLISQLALGRTEGADRLPTSLTRPALNIRGIRVGGVGEQAANVISTEARASIDFRLVPDQTPERVRELTTAHLEAQGWTVVDQEPDAATRAASPRLVRAEWNLHYPAYRTSLEGPASRAIVTAVEKVSGPVLTIPMLGGSVPMRPLADALGMPIVGLPLANSDNNQHGANENLRLQNLWDGIEIYAELLTGLSW